MFFATAHLLAPIGVHIAPVFSTITVRRWGASSINGALTFTVRDLRNILRSFSTLRIVCGPAPIGPVFDGGASQFNLHLSNCCASVQSSFEQLLHYCASSLRGVSGGADTGFHGPQSTSLAGGLTADHRLRVKQFGRWSSGTGPGVYHQDS